MPDSGPCWRSASNNARLGAVIHDYQARATSHLSLQIGDTVHILEECRGWYRGTLLKNRLTGIFPASFIHLADSTPISSTGNEVPRRLDPLEHELSTVLPRWRQLLLNKFYVEKHEMFGKLHDAVLEILSIRKQLATRSLSLDEQRQLRHRATFLIDWGHKIMSLPLTPRNKDKEVVDERSVPLIDLHRMHQQSAQEMAKGDSTIRTLSVSVITSAVRKGTDISEKLHHLYFRLCSLECQVPGEFELHASLYDMRDDSFFSERCTMKYDKNGEPTSYGGADNLRFIFTDLGAFEQLRKEPYMYLVFHVIRIGDMMVDQKPSKEAFRFRRPYACAVFPVDSILQKPIQPQPEAEVFTAELYQCSNDQDFAAVHTSIIKKQAGNYKPLLARLDFSLQSFHGLLTRVREGYPHLFQKPVPVCRKLGFPEVIMPGDARNDVFVSLLSGDFRGKDNKTAEKNMECTVSVLLKSGDVVEGGIVPGVSQDSASCYKSYIVRHTNTPQWGEIIKLDVPHDLFATAHVRFCAAHRSTNKKGFHSFMLAFLPLVHLQGTALADDEYNLIVYKCDASIFNHLEPAQYLGLPWNANIDEAPPNNHLPRSMSSSKTLRLKVRSTICSTKLTQNYDLLKFLKWRSLPDMLHSCLRGLMDVSGYEVVKFLRDTLDALFAILNEHSADCGQLVFQCLVHIIKLLNETKFENFRTVLNSYIEDHFSGSKIYEKLIHELKQSLHNAQNCSVVDQTYIRTVQSLQYIFRFIVMSRLLHTRSSPENDEEMFQADLLGVFDSFVAILEQDKSNTNTALQASLLQSFPTIFLEVLQVLQPDDFSRVIQRVLDCVPTNRLNNQKLHCIGRIVSSDLWRNEDARTILLPTLLYHLKSLMQQGELEAAKCLEIEGDLLRVLKQDDVGAIHDNTSIISKSFLAVLMRLSGQRGKSSQTATAATLFSSLLDLMTESHYQQYLVDFDSWEKAEGFLTEFFDALRKVLEKSPFPNDWAAMQIAVCKVFLKATKCFSTSMQEVLHRERKFSVSLWTSLFNLLMDIACAPALQLDKLPAAQQYDFLAKHGDIRVEVGKEVVDKWQQFDMTQKLSFVPSLAGVFLKISLLKQHELRRLVIPLFINMISCELAATGDFQQVCAELVDKLDDFVSIHDMGDNSYREHMHNIMEECCLQDAALRDAGGMEFVDYSTMLLERLLDLRNIPDGDEHMIPRMQAIINLMQYYKQMQRDAMYIRYIYRLAKFHLAAHNYSEAAFSLLNHAKILKWEDIAVTVKCDFPDLPPAKTELELKIHLYKMIIDFFDKAKVYEEAIPLCKELADQYELVTFQYKDLIPIYQRIADLFGKIVEEVRPVSEFFRVGFYGTKAPSFMKGKQFIFRGREFQHVSDFTHLLLASFPSASILNFNTEPDAEYEYKEGMFIQLSKVEPNIQLRDLERASVYASQPPANNVETFTLNRPVQKGEKKGFADMWIERTIYTTELPLPGLLHWSPVSHRETFDISPLANAVECIALKNREIRECKTRAEKNAEQLNPLSMILNGVIDAAVMGGLAVYEEAFLSKEYEESNPQDSKLVERLKELIKEQIIILGDGLVVHARLAPEAVRPLHEKMEERYLEMQQKYYPESIVHSTKTNFISPSPATSMNDLSRTAALNGDGSPGSARRPTVSVVAPAKAATSKAPKATTNLAAMTLAMFGGLEMAPAPSTTKSKPQSTPDNKANESATATTGKSAEKNGVHSSEQKLTRRQSGIESEILKSSSATRDTLLEITTGHRRRFYTFGTKPGGGGGGGGGGRNKRSMSLAHLSLDQDAPPRRATLSPTAAQHSPGPVPHNQSLSLPTDLDPRAMLSRPRAMSFVPKPGFSEGGGSVFRSNRRSRLCRPRSAILNGGGNDGKATGEYAEGDGDDDDDDDDDVAGNLLLASSPVIIKSSPRFTRSRNSKTSLQSLDEDGEPSKDQLTTVLDTETNGTSNPSVMLFAADTDADSGLGMVSTSLPAHLGRSSSENVTSTGTILLANRYDPREKDLQGYEAGDRSSPPVTQLSIV
ncbi:dedicator of cytokinesis protein 1-like isoform X2 [Sycon ciliatum]|uniref:dedicator of cytokinesis protein 1-like isoform X2 n=1 Tax=Sycon ciliatum TaxID=27933 RepID=UPI0031F61758